MSLRQSCARRFSVRRNVVARQEKSRCADYGPAAGNVRAGATARPLPARSRLLRCGWPAVDAEQHVGDGFGKAHRATVDPHAVRIGEVAHGLRHAIRHDHGQRTEVVRAGPAFVESDERRDDLLANVLCLRTPASLTSYVNVIG
ncbi:hypothetical protein [Burkholderia sp. Bp9140]|uniref:hypothetical protein n=1 Tax=Burkholderia sp. Bp9140 TaxID=2184572 RepID=UPI0016233C2F